MRESLKTRKEFTTGGCGRETASEISATETQEEPLSPAVSIGNRDGVGVGWGSWKADSKQ